MKVLSNISLKNFNTFGIDVAAKEFVEVTTIDELRVFVVNFNLNTRNLLILGGGSNILLTKDFDGMVIKISIKGINVIKEDDEFVWVKANAGESWHDLVSYCVSKGYGGIENLSLIPGCVGAAPMQNIGAYGVEIKDVFESLDAVEIETDKLTTFLNKECKFGYRESIFKNEKKGKYIIVSCTFLLSKKPKPNISYGAIKQLLDKKGIENISIKDVSDAVIEIRKSKLPDPKILGNSGSFFKNPEIPNSQFEQLKNNFPEIKGYPAPDKKTKIAAGWLIEKCGWKGKKVGNTGSHKDQALVLVNYGNATGNEVLALATEIQRSVREKFGIDLTPEVNIF